MSDYEIRLTDLAAARGGNGLERKVREEISELLENGLAAPLELVFHTFEFEGDEFICYPREGAIEVDTCHRDKLDKAITRGPMKGKSVLMPYGDSGNSPK